MLETSVLQVVAIAVGILIVATRLTGVIFPDAITRLLKGMIAEKGVLLLLLVYSAALGGLFIWGFRLQYASVEGTGWQAFVLLIFGVIVTLLSLLSLASPKVLLGLAAKFTDASSTNMRLLCALGVVVGVLLILLGVSM